jgi:hypothetical protein
VGVHGDIQEDLFRGQLGREVARRLELGGVEPGEAVQVPAEGGGVTGDGRGGGRQSGRGGWRGGRGASSSGARPSGRFCYRFGGSGGSGGRDRRGGPGTAATARDPGEKGPDSVVVEDCDAVVRCHPRVAPEGLGGAVNVDVVGAGRGGRGGARPEAHHVVQEGAGREKDLAAGLVVEAPAAQVGREVEVAGRGSRLRLLPRRGELLELPDRKRASTRRGVEGTWSASPCLGPGAMRGRRSATAKRPAGRLSPGQSPGQSAILPNIRVTTPGKETERVGGNRLRSGAGGDADPG